MSPSEPRLATIAKLLLDTTDSILDTLDLLSRSSCSPAQTANAVQLKQVGNRLISEISLLFPSFPACTETCEPSNFALNNAPPTHDHNTSADTLKPADQKILEFVAWIRSCLNAIQPSAIQLHQPLKNILPQTASNNSPSALNPQNELVLKLQLALDALQKFPTLNTQQPSVKFSPKQANSICDSNASNFLHNSAPSRNVPLEPPPNSARFESHQSQQPVSDLPCAQSLEKLDYSKQKYATNNQPKAFFLNERASNSIQKQLTLDLNHLAIKQKSALPQLVPLTVSPTISSKDLNSQSYPNKKNTFWRKNSVSLSPLAKSFEESSFKPSTNMYPVSTKYKTVDMQDQSFLVTNIKQMLNTSAELIGYLEPHIFKFLNSISKHNTYELNTLSPSTTNHTTGLSLSNTNLNSEQSSKTNNSNSLISSRDLELSSDLPQNLNEPNSESSSINELISFKESCSNLSMAITDQPQNYIDKNKVELLVQDTIESFVKLSKHILHKNILQTANKNTLNCYRNLVQTTRVLGSYLSL
ncbi:hypothetical protein BB561_003127 [Smittium simulii]|uniref:Uncharacterized protein n=1 Tax=Smittium simulii TaxID=133385 RepID=A0A2T9YMS2_9FUNG|nr:hypothetical protein BB561_003127 [Smittium simulii]